MSISALIIARNEESSIEDALASLNFVDEIVVVLDRSVDKTKEKAKKFTKIIYSGSWTCEGKRRNFGLSKCKSDWILEIDSDEVVSKKLADEILFKTNTKRIDFYYIPLINYVSMKQIRNGWMACLAPEGKFLLFRKNSKLWKEGSVHPDYVLKGKKGEVFKNHLDHYMSKSLSDLILRFNRNTSLYAQDLKSKKINLIKLFSMRKIFSRFIKSFLFKKGYKAGGQGILISILCSIYPFISAIKSKYDD